MAGKRKGKLYILDFATPHNYREFRRIAAQKPEWFGQFDDLHSIPSAHLWRAPLAESRFRELLEACQGKAEFVPAPKAADIRPYYDHWMQYRGNEENERAEVLATQLTDIDRERGAKNAPAQGYSQKNFDLALRVVREARIG